MPSLLHALIRGLLYCFFRIFTKLEVQGLNNIPSKGGFILATNHLSILDPPLVYAILKRDDITVLAAKKHRKNPIFRLIINIVHGIWLNREEADSSALRAALAHLQAGGILGIAPEGTRSPTGTLITPKTGVAYLAARAKVPVLPVAIWGTENALSKIFALCRPTIMLSIGKLIYPQPIMRQDRERLLRHNTDEIMLGIAAMLPAKYWGVYANHPSLIEFDNPHQSGISQ